MAGVLTRREETGERPGEAGGEDEAGTGPLSFRELPKLGEEEGSALSLRRGHGPAGAWVSTLWPPEL